MSQRRAFDDTEASTEHATRLVDWLRESARAAVLNGWLGKVDPAKECARQMELPPCAPRLGPLQARELGVLAPVLDGDASKEGVRLGVKPDDSLGPGRPITRRNPAFRQRRQLRLELHHDTQPLTLRRARLSRQAPCKQGELLPLRRRSVAELTWALSSSAASRASGSGRGKEAASRARLAAFISHKVWNPRRTPHSTSLAMLAAADSPTTNSSRPCTLHAFPKHMDVGARVGTD